jgi:uncharacterized short protein YbdD (DUF466 family)
MNHVNKAESFIAQNLFNDAITEYEIAFEEQKYPMPKDVHNLITCAQKRNDKELAKKFLIYLIDNYKLAPKYYSKYKKLIPKNVRKKYSEEFKKDEFGYRNLIDSLFLADQEVRTSNNYINGTDKIKLTDSLSYEILKKRVFLVLKKEEFNSSFFFSKMNYEPDVKLYILIRHWFQQKLPNVEELFLELVKNGDFPPEVYADLVDVKYGFMMFHSKYGMFTEVKYEKQIKEINRKYEEIELIDSNRLIIGLPSYEEYLNNLKYFKTHSEFMYYQLNVLNLSGNVALKSIFDSL